MKNNNNENNNSSTVSPEMVNGGQFFKMAATIALPIMIQNLISTLVSTADTVMLGYVSQDAMAASSLANQVYTVLWMTLNGLITGGCVMASQYWGKKDHDTIERVMGLTVRFAFVISVIFFIVAFGFPTCVMRLFTNEENIIHEGAHYLRIVSFSYLFMGFSQIYLSIQRSIERVILPTATYIVSLAVNVLLNATFIFGLFHVPKLGLAGVAIGTVTARFVECLICAVHSRYTAGVKFRAKYVFAKSGILFRDFVKLSLPSLINDVAWSLAFSMYSVILGHLGSDVVAANAVANMVLNIGAIVTRGFANATTVIVGKTIGENNLLAAKIYAKRMVRLTAFFCVLGGAVIIGIRPFVMSAYAGKLTQSAVSYLGTMLIMQSYHLLGEGLNTCWICGCFRGGGDAKTGMVIDCFSMWLVAVPLMAVAAFVLKLPVEAVYFVMCLDEFEKMIPVYIHYRKYNWLTNITREKDELMCG